MAGPSFPVGKFAAKTPGDTSAGYAKTGIGLGILVGYQLSDKLSVLLSVGGSQNKQDEAGLEARAKKEGFPGNRIEISSEKWKVGRLMAGVGFSMPISGKKNILSVSRLVAGACKTAIPGYSGLTYDNNNMVNGGFTFSKIALPWTFAYQLSTGIELGLSKHFAILSEVSYFNANPVWKYNKWSNYPNLPPVYTPAQVKFSLSMVNLMAGVKIKF